MGLKKLIKIVKGREKAWDIFLKPAFTVAATFIGMAVGAKLKNLKVDQATTKF